MKVAKYCVIFILFFYSCAFSNELGKERFRQIDKINQEYEEQIPTTKMIRNSRLYATDRTTSYPTSRPSGAQSITFKSYDDKFDFYIWFQNNSIWVEFVPLDSEPFICSSMFIIIQDGIQNDDVKIKDRSGNSFCNDLFVNSIFELGFYSFTDFEIDPSRPFTVIFDGGWSSGNQSFSVSTLTSSIPSSDDEDLDQTYQDGIEFCKSNPDKCGLYSQNDLNDRYDDGFDDGVASVDIPACEQNFTQDDLDDKYDEGFEAGVASIDTPECEQDFTQGDLDDKYDEGFEAGVASVDTPECEQGFTQDDLDDKYDAGFDDGVASVDISECEECTDQEQTGVTLTPELNMHIPLIQYSTLLGDLKLWGDFEFISGENGELLWQLVDFGEMTDN